MAPSIVCIECKSASRLMPQANLQSVVPGLAYVIPNPEVPIVGVQESPAKPRECTAEAVNRSSGASRTITKAGASWVRRAPNSRQSVPLLRSEEPASQRADVIHFQDRFWQDFPLQPEVRVEDVRVANSRRKD